MNEMIRSYKIQKVLAIVSIAGYACNFIYNFIIGQKYHYNVSSTLFQNLLWIAAAVMLFLYSAKQSKNFSAANTPSPLVLIVVGIAGLSTGLVGTAYFRYMAIYSITMIAMAICMFLSTASLKLHLNKISKISALAALVFLIAVIVLGHYSFLNALLVIASEGAFILVLLFSAQAVGSVTDECKENLKAAMHKAVTEDSFEAQFLKNINDDSQ